MSNSRIDERQSVICSAYYKNKLRRAAGSEVVMYKICSLFAGVGGIDLGFIQTNKCEVVYANEFDKYNPSSRIEIHTIATNCPVNVA